VCDLTPVLRARFLGLLSECERGLGDVEGAASRALEAVAVSRASGDRRLLANTLHPLGVAQSLGGDFGGARASFEEALAIHRELGDTKYVAVNLCSLGELARTGGDLPAARAYYERALEEAGRGASSLLHAVLHVNIAGVSLEDGDVAAAGASYRESLAVAAELGNGLFSVIALDGLGAVALAALAPERSALLGGAAEALCEAEGYTLEPTERALHDRYVSALREQLDREVLEREWSRGRSLTRVEATAIALGA
jgi:tetratricopeptide (TPR) repeat protein